MRIGILTFHCAHNFGAVLQAFALQSQLQLMGYSNTKIINYRPKYLDRGMPVLHRWMFTKGRAWNTICRYFKITRREQKSYKKYHLFEQKYLSLTEKCETPNELESIINNFDYLILGSDQIWNEKFNGCETIWLGDFKNFRGQIVIYAASAGNQDFSLAWKEKLKIRLPQYKSISVRESLLIPKLQNIINTNVDIRTVLDPTLMVDPQIWNSFEIVNNKNKGRYILCYQARKSDDVYRIAHELSKQLNAKIISVDFWENSFKSGIKNSTVAPNEFITLVKNAQCVVTTSFHGTIFSIICNTPFYTLRLNDGADGRVESLLKILKIEDRMIDSSITPIFSKCEFENVDKILLNLRIDSQNYLTKSLI